MVNMLARLAVGVLEVVDRWLVRFMNVTSWSWGHTSQNGETRG